VTAPRAGSKATYIGALRPERTLVLVVAPPRGGGGVLAGALQRLGMHVPVPEVDGLDAESQWVIDFHSRLLARAGVQLADARPAAWADAAEAALDREVQRQLRDWLDARFRGHDAIVIKDPRLAWFVPLWRQCGETLDAPPRFAIVLRHPGEVVDTPGRTAGWINHTLFSERATRDAPRAFVRHDELMEDWVRAVGRAGEALDLAVVRDAQVPAMRRAAEFVRAAPRDEQSGWSTLPDALRQRADEVWQLATRLAAGDDALDRLEAARAAYVAFYDEVEATAQSSLAAAARGRAREGAATLSGRGVGLARRVPAGLRHRVPLRWRKRLVRVIASR
jgi:hypothetical protein